MNTADSLVKSVLQKNNLSECSLDELQSIVAQFPYFTAARFMLAEKLRASDASAFEKEARKLSLHIRDPLWLDFLLNGYKEESMEPTSNREENTGSEDRIAEPMESFEPVSSEAIIIPPPQEITKFEENIDDRTAEEPGINDLPGSADHSQPDEPAEQPSDRMAGENSSMEPGTSIGDSVETEGDEVNDVEREDTQIPMKLPDLNQPVTDAGISFEPYHTVDYFASQGIRFVPEERPADRFGQQLRSFTEWLKSMKKVQQSEALKPADLQSEEKVQQLANHSVNEQDVVTEAMAEVWLKQGNREKAVEIYDKLSLLNPSKSAYFASLAKQLK